MSSSHLRAGATHYCVAFVARTLALDVMPLKGALMLATARQGDARVVSDVDILVREREYDAATRQLISKGFRLEAIDHDDRSRTFCGPIPLPLDLHRRLFSEHMFEMPTSDIFARSRPSDRFGVPVLLPSPEDAFAHVVGHAVKSRRVQAEQSADLAALLESHALEPSRVAHHLHICGLGRAARIALAGENDTNILKVLAALPHDPFGERIVQIASGAESVVPKFIAMHAVNTSVPRGVRSLLAHVRHTIIARARTRWSRH